MITLFLIFISFLLVIIPIIYIVISIDRTKAQKSLEQGKFLAGKARNKIDQKYNVRK